MRTWVDYWQGFLLVILISEIYARYGWLYFTGQHLPATFKGLLKLMKRPTEYAVIVFLQLWFFVLMIYAFHLDVAKIPWWLHVRLFSSDTVSLVGVVMATVCVAAFPWIMISFRSSWRVGIDIETPGELVTTGAFAYSRNPMYVFLDVYFMAALLMNGTLIFLIWLVVGMVLIHRLILHEERFLERHYGQAYVEYKANAPRYI